MVTRIDRSCSLWMGDIEPDMNQSYILSAFRLTGERAVSVRMIQDKLTGGQARYCFVTFDTPEEANNAMLRLNGKALPQCYDGTRRFKLNSSSNQKNAALPVPEYSLFVGDLSEDIDDLALYQCFAARYSSVKCAKVVQDTNGSRGYGFVRFTDESEQLRALKEMDKTNFMGGPPIKVSQATAKNAYLHRPGVPVPVTTAATPNPMNYGYGMGYDYSAYANMNAYYGYNTDAYSQQYTQQYQDMSSYQQQQAAMWQPNTPQMVQNEEDDELVDPNDYTDNATLNEKFKKQSEEFYSALEDSRWHALDNVYSTITEVK